MRLRRSPQPLLPLAVIFVVATVCFASPLSALAQGTPTPPAPVTPAATVPSTPGTPTPTRTATLTPTATPTLTALGAKLALAKAFLDGGDFQRAQALFAEVAELDRGNAAALAGIGAALSGQAARTATALAPAPTPEATPTPIVPGPTLASAVAGRVREWGAMGFAGLLLLVAAWLAAQAVRWLLFEARELWLARGLPLLGRPARAPGFLLADFTEAGAPSSHLPRVLALALAEKLVEWNHLVQAQETPVEPAAAIELGGMAWLKILWSWVLPPSRNCRVSGVLFKGAGASYRLALQRTEPRSNSVDGSRIFEATAASPEDACRALAAEAAKWLLLPDEMEADRLPHVSATRGMPAGAAYDRAMALLLPVRAQIGQGAIDFPWARKQIAEAAEVAQQLPAGSTLRRTLEGVIAGMRKDVPSA